MRIALSPIKEIFSKIMAWLDIHGMGELLSDQLPPLTSMNSWETIVSYTAFIGIGAIVLWVVAIRPAKDRWLEKSAEKVKVETSDG